MRVTRRDAQLDGQALAEFALVFPLFLIVLFSIITFGLYVFYNQQLESAVRAAARYAAVHSSTAQCPTVSRIDPTLSNQPQGYFRCDAPEDGWPRMTAAARSSIWGIAPGQVSVRACWAGLVDGNTPPNADALPTTPGATFQDCTIGGVNPKTAPGSLDCPGPITTASAYGTTGGKADGDDTASAIAATVSTNTHYPTAVTVYACFRWRPPMAGFIFIPSEIVLKAVSTESLQRQQ